MKLPNKIFPYDQSILAPIPATVEALTAHPTRILDLYQHVHRVYPHIAPQDFADMLSVLYALQAITVDESGVIHNAH